MAALIWVLQRTPSVKSAALAGLGFATVWLSATFWWLYIAMHTYGGLNGGLAAVAVVALAAALGTYYAAASAGFRALGRARPWMASAGFAAFWTVAEMARGTWLTGFGWGAVGYAHTDGPLGWYAPWLGVYGVGAIAAFVAASIATMARRAWVPLAAMLVLLAAPALAPVALNQWTLPAGELSVTLLQGNIAQNEKFESGSGVPVALQWYGEQLQASRSGLVVAPETAIPLLPTQLPEGYWPALTRQFASDGRAALIGIPLGSYLEGYTNSVVGLQPNQVQIWRYDKHHLVPFGEFIPPMFRWFIDLMHIPLGDFNRGPLAQPSFKVAGQRLAPNICYEDLFGEELGMRFADAASAPTVFVNVSNIAWFGDTIAIDQHLHISRMRALEFQRPFVRATNTGSTVILDHRANVAAALPRLTRGVLTGTVQGRTGNTPYAWWVSHFGLWPLWILMLVTGAWALWAARRRDKEA
jgi:apolipoprotein N-acyltransferase